MPTTRRQNISRNPATAAKADAIGISESGPIYKLHSFRMRRWRERLAIVRQART